MDVRKIRRAEAKAYSQIAGYSFGGWSDEVDESHLDSINLDNALAVFVDGELVSRLINHSYRQAIRGVWRPVSGIGGVCTYPEHRRRGYVRHLFSATFEDMHEKGQVGSTLYPFSESFYAMFGYVSTNSPLRMRVPTHAFLHHMANGSNSAESWHTVRKPAIDAVEPFLDFATEVGQAPERIDYHGYMLDPQQEPRGWGNQMTVFLYREHEGAQHCEAAARYSIKGYGDGEITVHEMHWRTLAGRDRLLGFWALHGDNAPHTWVYVPPNINVQTWLHRPPHSFETKISHLPMMARVVDVLGAIQGTPLPGAAQMGEVRFGIKDEQCPWNSGSYRLTAADGQLHIEKVGTSVDITFTTVGISALVYGTLALAEIEHRGWVLGLDDAARQRLHTWFPPTLMFNVKFF